jgi:hypothetical protein
MRQAFSVVVAALGLLASTEAAARTMAPGSISLAGSLGPGVSLGSRLGSSDGYLILGAEAEYDVSSSASGIVDASFGLATTKPLRLNAGTRLRATGIDLPLSPYIQVQASVGRLFNALGSNINFVGGRLGVGLDYFLTAKMAAGGLVAVTAGSTLADRAAFYGVFDMLFYARYSL